MKSIFPIIYGLIGDNDEVRYIGQSLHGLSRPRSHLNRSLKMNKGGTLLSLPLSCWIRECGKYKIKVIKMLQGTLNKKEMKILLDKEEEHYIKYYRDLGHRLFNITDGGSGSSGLKPTKEIKKKISNTLKNKKVDASANKKPKQVKNIDDGKEFSSIRQASIFYEIERRYIRSCCNNEIKNTSAGKFIFVAKD